MRRHHLFWNERRSPLLVMLCQARREGHPKHEQAGKRFELVGHFQQGGTNVVLEGKRISKAEPPVCQPFGQDRGKEFKGVLLDLSLLEGIKVLHGFIVTHQSPAGVRGDHGGGCDALLLVCFDEGPGKGTLA